MPSPKNLSFVPREVREALARNKRASVDSSELFSAIITSFGGPMALAEALHGEFVGAKEGSLVRTRIIELTARLCIQVTQQEIAKPLDTQTMSDEELVAQAGALIGKLNGLPEEKKQTQD